ncbi:MAG: DegT/DnrJ/EryC1/StrS family aminotransferase [Gemmatimonadaceae bacterium]|jgi:dTDP-4-amino-4,6-dideoxygalactose transaminase|nr:DegT/DnrJ/EryC1/StrS family aminotransferase [Gemmatimonadaceae bacterium]
MTNDRPPRIYMSVPHMSGDEQPFIADAFESNWLSSVGPSLDGFEREVAARLGGVHTLGVASGTAAIHLVLRYAGVGPGDRVAVQSATFAGGAFPVVYQGATPVFIDSEPVTGGMDPSLAAQYLEDAARRNELPRALVVAHLYGQHCDVDPIAEACAQHGVTLIEDAAESLGSTYKGRETATTAPLSALSFNGNKIITTTGGGMCVARDPAAIPVLRKWSTQSKEAKVEYEHVELGYNYRMSNVLAAIGRGQLRVLDERVRQRQAVFARYAAAFADVPGVRMQDEAPWGTHTRWLSIIHLDPAAHGRTPNDLVVALERDNIEARPIWRPMHTQPLFAECRAIGGAVSESLFRTGLCLPSSSRLAAAPATQDQVIAKVLAVLGH